MDVPRSARKILIVVDSLIADSPDDGDLSLSLFTEVLGQAGFGVELRRYARGGAPFFSVLLDPERRLRYHATLLFGWDHRGPKGARQLADDEQALVEQCMDAGMGLFATGDHAEIGGFLASGIKRVRLMRRWSGPQLPLRVGGFRRGTVSVDDGGREHPALEDDGRGQRIYPNCTTQARGHALLHHDGELLINVLPDHSHEGSCVDPGDPAFVAAWNQQHPGDAPPELVAWSISHGVGHADDMQKLAPIPATTFPCIVAWDGHLNGRGQGRVVVQSSLHHFVNGNLRPLQRRGGLPWQLLQRYFCNLACWLTAPLSEEKTPALASTTTENLS